MRISVSKVYRFDIDAERKRIESWYTGDVRTRQLEIINAFGEGNLELVVTLYNNLPFNEEDNIPEQALVSKKILQFFLDIQDKRFDKIDTIMNERHMFVTPPKIEKA